MNRTQKQEVVETLHADFARSPHAILVDFRGLSVPAVTEFRRRVRQSGSQYRVVKNNLARRAIEGTPLASLEEGFVNTTGVAYTADDPVALAKALVDFAKDNPELVVKSGIVAGSQRLDAEGVKALSALPSLPEMRATLLGVLMAPATKLARLLNTPGNQLAQVLKAHQEKSEGE